MGWIATRTTSLTHGLLDDQVEVEEEPGFTGARVTPTGQRHNAREFKFTVPRRGRTVWATRDEAVNAFEEAKQ